MGNADQQRYPVLSKGDDDLLAEIFSMLTSRVHANPYAKDGAYASAIMTLPKGLRAMAATHHLDVSLMLDDIGWHFLNFGQQDFVRETESGLRELGLCELAEWFAEAYAIVDPLRPEIDESHEYVECLRRHGCLDRIFELTRKATNNAGVRGPGGGSVIYGAWIKYARANPDNVFGT